MMVVILAVAAAVIALFFAFIWDITADMGYYDTRTNFPMKWAICLFIVSVIFIGIAGYRSTPEYQAELKKEEAAELKKMQEDVIPRLISEKDGCKVYAFKAGERWHYFTRCATSTTTESTYSERVGKTTRERSEFNTTENK